LGLYGEQRGRAAATQLGEYLLVDYMTKKRKRI